MKSLVVYESFFGNTESVARAVAEGLAIHGTADAAAVGSVDATTLTDVDLLVVGAPTHAWGLPRGRTRAGLPAVDASAPLVREWLDNAPLGGGRSATSFSTRLDKPRFVTGSAAGGIARRLKRRGWTIIERPMSFVVNGTEGPLGERELDKARTWGDELGARVPAVPRLSS
jgi:hypothetical protein